MNTGAKVAVITGGTSGIGRECVYLFVKNGYYVESTYHTNFEAAESITRELGVDNVNFQKLDLADNQSGLNLIQNIIKKHASVDVFVYNAGISRVKLFNQYSYEEWLNIFQINFLSVHGLLQKICDQMIIQKYGNIVLVSSLACLTPNMGQSAYAGSKSALVVLGKVLSKELGRFNIRVNSVSPGYIATELLKREHNNAVSNNLKNVALNRLGRPEEVANVIIFLSSEKASYITGANLIIDGGLS